MSSYTSTSWSSGLVITSDRLNNIESGISTIASDVAPVTDYHNSGAHNSIYRGKSLGSSFTSTQAGYISAGTFTDMYIGDYWTINSVNWRIAAFDYYYNCGSSYNCSTHHAVIVPDSCILTSQQMNESATTEGGYVGSYMYTDVLPEALTLAQEAFGSDYILTHEIYLHNAVTDGHPSAGAWYDSQIELMTERMVYGNTVYAPSETGSSVFTNYTVEKSQLPLFTLNPRYIGIRSGFWLRDVVSSAYFAYVNANGYASYTSASAAYGVRPAFCIS